MRQPNTESAIEYFEEHIADIFRSYLEADKVEDEDIIAIILNDAELYDRVMVKWLKTHREELLDWYMRSLPEGREE
jgi:hypothetical protein